MLASLFPAPQLSHRFLKGRRPTRWEGQADTAGGGREPDLPHGSSIQASPRRQQAWPAAARNDHDSTLLDLSAINAEHLCALHRHEVSRLQCHTQVGAQAVPRSLPKLGQAVVCSTPRDYKMSSPPSLLTFTPRPNSSQLHHPFPIPRTHGCARLLASPWT